MIDEAILAQINNRYECPADAGPAWRAACEYGFDMSIVADNLRLAPERRLERHRRASDMILELQNVPGWTDQGLLSQLRRHDVEFVIVGEVCGAAHRLSLVTEGLEVCCAFTRENLYRIQDAMRDLHPRYRLTANKIRFELTDELCSRLKNLYLLTDWGILDCLSEVAGIGDYEQVWQRSTIHKMSFGEIRILEIDALIAAKKAVGRERDLAAVLQLESIKEMRIRGIPSL